MKIQILKVPKWHNDMVSQEAERAREAFNSLSDDEKVALMQQVAQQEQAMAEQQVPVSPEEQMMMQQQGQMVSPEEMAMMQQAQGVPIQEGMAYGGEVNRFDYGGDLYNQALQYLESQYKKIGNKTDIAQGLAKLYLKNHPDAATSKKLPGSFAKEMQIILKGKAGTFRRGATTDIYYEDGKYAGDARNHYNNLISLGIRKDVAFELAFPEGKTDYQKGVRNRIYSELVGGKATPKNNTVVEPESTVKSPTIQQNSIIKMPWQGGISNGEAQAEKKASGRYKNSKTGEAFDTREAAEASVDAYNKAHGVGKYRVTANTGNTVTSNTNKNNGAAIGTKSANTSTTAATSKSTGAKKAINVGDWNGMVDNPWFQYSRNDLDEFLAKAEADILAAKAMGNEAEVNRIRQETVNTFNDIQQSYWNNILEGKDKLTQSYSPEVKRHQEKWNEVTGNRGFYATDENGNVIRNVQDAITLPSGHNTSDRPGNWIDGYNGPQTGLRYFGATENGNTDYFNDVANRFRNLGIDFSPYDDWEYTDDNGNNPSNLYRLSVIGQNNTGTITTPWNGDTTAAPAATEEEYNYLYRPSEESPSPLVKTPWSEYADNKPASTTDNTDNNGNKKYAPVLRKEWPRYVGLFGPAVGLGMMAAGIGKPDYNILNGVLDTFDKDGTKLADYQRIGNYLVYRPMDIWAEQNRMNANARATDRALLNNAAPVGTQAASLLANAYNNQIASGQLYRNALEYNDNLRKQVADFNRGTDMFNAQAYNQTSQTNAQLRNHDRALRAQLAMSAAAQKMDAERGWYNSLYGNVGGLFKGISDLGRENTERNWLARLAASGAIPGIVPENAMNADLVREVTTSAKGGKLKKKKRGLTC